MKILFIPQNETHLMNMIPVSDELKVQGYDIRFLDTKKWYFQKLEFRDSDKLEIIPGKYVLTKSFFNFSNIKRLLIVLRFYKYLLNITNNYDIFVFGTETALHRVMILNAIKNKKKTILIQDGIITDSRYSLIDVIKNSTELITDLRLYIKEYFNKKIIRYFRIGKLNFMLPGLDGSSGVDYIFTMGNYTKSVLDKRKKNRTKVISSGIPRYKKVHKDEYFFDKDIFNICYITSAYKWHGHYSFDEYQHDDIKLLCKLIGNYNKENIKLNIKIHPREDILDYSKYKKNSFVNIIIDKDIKFCFQTQNLLFSQISTTLIEAIQSKRKMYSLFIHYPYWKRKGTFSEKDFMDKILNENELTTILKNAYQESSNYYSYVDENAVKDFISENTNNSAFNIANIIIKASNHLS